MPEHTLAGQSSEVFILILFFFDLNADGASFISHMPSVLELEQTKAKTYLSFPLSITETLQQLPSYAFI